MKIRALGDAAFVLEYDDGEMSITRLNRASEALRQDPPPGVIEAQAAFSSLTVFYDPVRVGDWKSLAATVSAAALAGSAESQAPRTIEIPVVYGGEFGPDLEALAQFARLPPSEVIAVHSSIEYVATAVGFVPGFAYLEGLPERLQMPRRQTPRTRAPAGSVAIGGRYTAVYPFEVPAGWNLIGRTALTLFDVARAEPASIRAGDRVRFCQCT